MRPALVWLDDVAAGDGDDAFRSDVGVSQQSPQEGDPVEELESHLRAPRPDDDGTGGVPLGFVTSNALVMKLQ